MSVAPLFTLRCSLQHHSKSISVLNIHPDGHILLSGADDATIVLWNLDTGELLQEVSFEFHGPVTAACWIPAVHGSTKAFAFGCADGSIHVYALDHKGSVYHPASFRRAHEGPVEDVAFEPMYRRLASVGRGALQVWIMNEDYSIKEIHPPIAKKPYIARNVQFCDHGKVLLVFFLESHEIIAYNLEPFGEKWATEIPTRNGYATFSQDQQSLLISNLVNGIDAYSISSVSPGVSPTLLQSFRHSIRSNVPLQVTSGMQGNWVIGGSDDGSVRIFDQRSGDLLKCLRHGDVDSLVQVVAAHSQGDTCMIVSGSTSPGPPIIKVWWHKTARLQDKSPVAVESLDHKWNTWQICAIVTLVSIAVNFVMPYLPRLIEHISTWLLSRLAASDDTNGVPIDRTVQSDGSAGTGIIVL